MTNLPLSIESAAALPQLMAVLLLAVAFQQERFKSLSGSLWRRRWAKWRWRDLLQYLCSVRHWQLLGRLTVNAGVFFSCLGYGFAIYGFVMVLTFHSASGMDGFVAWCGETSLLLGLLSTPGVMYTLLGGILDHFFGPDKEQHDMRRPAF